MESGPPGRHRAQPGRDARPANGGGSSRTPRTGRAPYRRDLQFSHRALSSRWVITSRLQAGLHPPPGWAPDTREYPSAWRALGKSPPGENSRLSFNQLEKANSLFCASSFIEQETQKKSPPGHSGLRKATHTPLWGQGPAQLSHSPVPSTDAPVAGYPQSKVKARKIWWNVCMFSNFSDDAASLTICG